jgi:hypothetical protein
MNIAEAGTAITIDGIDIAVELADGRVFDYCKRCGGTGHYSFNQIDGTVCYGCNGSGLGKVTTRVDAIKRANARRAAARKRQRVEEARLVKQEQERQEWADAHSELAEGLAKVAKAHRDEDSSILGIGVLLDFAQQAQWRPLSPKQTDFATKLLAAYIERQDKISERKQAQAAAGHVGTVGEKLTIDAEIVFTKLIEGSFNGRPTYSTLVIMKTTDGATLKTFSSGAFGDVAEQNVHEVIRITGTVKAHEERDGLLETSLTRVKAL